EPHRGIERGAQTCTRAGLAGGACTRVETHPEAVDAEEKHLRIGVKNVLRAVAVVNVPIDDKYARQAEARAGPLSGQGDVVEKAETHAMGRRGMMAGRPDQAQGVRVLPMQHGVDGTGTSAGGGQGDLEGLRTDDRVDIKQAAPRVRHVPRARDNVAVVNL